MKKTVVVTGGNCGLGKEIAKGLSSDYNVVIIGTNKDTILETTKELKCKGYVCDIRDYKQVLDVINLVKKDYDSIDILINNAGLYINGGLVDNDALDLKDVMDVNLLGTINCTKAVLNAMMAQNSGQIININSQLGLSSRAERSIYTASKWGVTGFSRCIEQEVSKHNIKVTDLLLGTLDETMMKNGKKELRPGRYLDKNDIVSVIKNIILLPDYMCISEILIKSIEELKY